MDADTIGKWVQLFIGIVALTTAVVQGVSASYRFLVRHRERGAEAPRQAIVEETQPLKLLDLAPVLVCAALFAMLLVDALLVSRNVAVPTSATATLGIVGLVTGTLILAWYVRKPEISIGWWASAVLVLLCFAPNGPFAQQKQSITPINPWVPIPVLVFLAIAMWIYKLGSPLNRDIGTRKQLQALVVILLVSTLATAALGRHLQRMIESDPKTPKLSSPGTREALEDIDGWSTVQKRAFYSAISDVRLQGLYAQYAKSSGVEATPSDLFADSGPFDPEKLAAVSSLLLDEGYDEVAATDLSNAAARIVNEGIGRENFRKELAAIDVEPFSAAPLADDIFAILSGPGVKTLRDRRMIDVLNAFQSDLAREKQLSYLTNRLTWTHPTGVGDQSLIALPGLTAEDRFTELSDDRIEHALLQRNSQVRALLRELNYPDTIVEAFRNSPTLRASTDNAQNTTEVFPDLGQEEFLDRLQEQLSLPVPEEAFLAFEEYKWLARDLLQQDLARELGLDLRREDNVNNPDKIGGIFNTFDTLKPNLQEAFILYFITEETENYDNYYAIVALEDNNVDLSAIKSDNGVQAVREIVAMVESNSKIDDTSPFSDTAQAIRSISNKEQRLNVLRLLRVQIPTNPIHNLLDPAVIELVVTLKETLDDTQRQRLFNVIDRPVTPVVRYLIEEGFLELPNAADQPLTNAAEAFEHFDELDTMGQEGYLHQLALSLYRAEGERAHNIIGLVVLQADMYSSTAGLLIAALICSPLVLASVVLAFFAAQRLTARDKLRALVITEAAKHDLGRYELGITDVIRGRSDIIIRLKSLAGRGWSSIALVGRRGIGKTRVLYELMRLGYGGQQRTAITAWLATPSKFDEAEFIESVMERLTAAVEHTIAQRLGAKPLEVRRLEKNSTLTVTLVYLLLLLAVGLIFIPMSARAASSQIISTWFPIFVVLAMSVAVYISHLTQMQPIDLSGWLERDRSNSPHTVLLYREARRAREFLASRRRANGERTIARRALRLPNASGYSLMSLISEYREFIERAVYRIRMGALGPRKVDDFEVVVCIDELDKIVDPNELRGFLRRMKVIFEIPGAYYYLSLSEDTLRALYLSPAEGKNEVDSAFDHIIRVPPVTCDLGEEITQSYIQKHGSSKEDTRLYRLIAAISYGVPRDIIRRCDELIAKGNLADTEPRHISDELRRRQAELAYGENLLSKREFLEFRRDAEQAAAALQTLFETPPSNTSSARVMLSLWVLALLSVTVATQGDEQWHIVSERLRDIGYRIVEERVEDLVDELRNVQQEVLSQPAIA